MPKINKVRITGARYDNFRKGYEDALIDFTRNDEPDHTLITLVNQGGKGFLMQLLSQITMPDTRWGKESGNRIISMFYDRYRNFKPYTFHVIIEWKLDTIPEKWLLTGICVTAAKRNSVDELEEKTGLNYFHYTVEHDNSGFFSIEQIPVYDTNNKCPAAFDIFENYIDNNSKYIVKYPMSQTRRLNSNYYEYLKSRGIYRAEWEMMKTINRDEGGVRNYFSKATDNKSVIDKMLIQSITQNMSNYNENASESLKEMFISNLSITKDLPRLIERENDYKELLMLIAPLLETTEFGLKNVTAIDKHIREGNLILASLYNMLESAEDQQNGWIEKKNEAQKELGELHFQRDNIEYAHARRTKIERQREQEKLNQALESIKENLAGYETSEKDIQTDIFLKKRENDIEKRDIIRQQKQDLINSLGIQNVQEEIKKLEDIIISKWDKSRSFFERISAEHSAYQSKLKKNVNELSNSKKSLQKRLEGILIELGIFNERVIKHKDTFNELSRMFDFFRLAVPEYLLDELKVELEKLKESERNIEEQIHRNEEEQKQTEKRQYEIQIQLGHDKNELKELDMKFQQIREAENSIKQNICEAIGVDATTVEYTHQWAKSQKPVLKALSQQEEKRLDELKTQVLSIQIDLGINQNEYWIPNQDIQTVKETFLKAGVRAVMTGTEFINSLESTELKRKLISQNPLLPYGILLPSDKEWLIIQKNIDRKLFLRSGVPVFIRSDIDGTFINSVENTALELAVDNNAYLDWLNSLKDKASGFRDVIKTVEQKKEKFLGLCHKIDAFVQNQESSVIWENIRQLNVQVEKHQKGLEQIEIQLRKLLELIDADKKLLEETAANIQKTAENMKKLSDYVEEENEIKAKKPEMDKKEQMQKDLKKEIQTIEDNIVKADKDAFDDEKSFTSWKVELQQKIKSVRVVISNAFIAYEKSLEFTYDKPPEYRLDDPENIFMDLQKREDLNREVEQKNAQILVYDEKIRNLDEKISVFETELEKLTAAWREKKPADDSMQYLQQALGEVCIKIKDTQNSLNKTEKQISSIQGELNGLEKSISGLRTKILERHNKSPEPWDEIDLKHKEYEINRNLMATQSKLKSFEDFIVKTGKKINEINLSLSGLKVYEELEAERGHVDDSVIARLENNAKQMVDVWQNEFRNLKRRLTDSESKMKRELESFQVEIRERIKEKILFEKLNTEIQNIRINNFKANLESFTSMKEHFQREMETTSSDKAKAEQVREQWAQRASKHVIRIIELMKEMVRGMVYINRNGYAFPLIKLKGDELMPTNEDEIVVLLKEHFVQSINEIINKKIPVEDIDDSTLDNLMGEQALFSKAVRGRYPLLMVYKMTEKNEFQYAKPHDYYYASWEALNRGEEGSAEGSGGQKLAISTFMMMMLVNYKKRTVGSNSPWTVLLMDNPFGQASAKHILDPIFEIASSLNFQLVAFAPPEIIKIEISKRFPVFWELRIEEVENNYSSMITSRLIHGGRKIL
jgi:chromosome segregation ATPase